MTKKIVLIASLAESLIAFRVHLIKALQAEGYEVIACAPLDNDSTNIKAVDRLTEMNVKFIPIPLSRTGLNPFKDIILCMRLIFLMRVLKPTAVLSYTIKPVLYGSLSAKIAGVPHIYAMMTGLGYLFSEDEKSILKSVIKPFFKIALWCNQAVFFQNPDDLNKLLEERLLSSKLQTVLINGSGVCLQEFMPVPYPKEIVFLFVGRFLINKGIREYVEAASQIKKKYPDIKFILAGWLDDNPNSIHPEELSSWRDQNIIDCLGRLEDVRPAIQRSSVLVLPSYAEGTPRSVLEAMAMSRPIITTDVPGCRETVQHHKNGFLVPKKDSVALANAMQKFIDNPSLVHQMGSVSRQMAVEKYDVHKVNQTILSGMQV